MIVEKGKHVKCLLKAGALAEGIVEEWCANEVQLKSLDGESILIITHPAEDIMLIKIMLPMPEIDLPVVDVVEDSIDVVGSRGIQILKGELEHKFEEAKKLPSSDPERLKTLAELRSMMATQEKKIITEKVRNHYPDSAYDLGNRTRLTYGYPGFIKKSNPK